VANPVAYRWSGSAWVPVVGQAGTYLAAANALSELVGSEAAARANIGAAPLARQILAGAGLTGGGDLSADRTLALGFRGCLARQSVAQSIPTGTATDLTLDGEDFDTDAFHSLTVNNTRLTVPAGLGGYYLAVGTVVLMGAAAGTLYDAIVRKNALTALTVARGANPGGNSPVVQAVWVGPLVAGDFIEVRAVQQSGAAMNTSPVAYGPQLFLAYLGG
jgi:hypothetical protein